MTIYYRCSNCGTSLPTTNADPLEGQIAVLLDGLTKAAERLEARGHKFGAREARAIVAAMGRPQEAVSGPDDIDLKIVTLPVVRIERDR